MKIKIETIMAKARFHNLHMILISISDNDNCIFQIKIQGFYAFSGMRGSL